VSELASGRTVAEMEGITRQRQAAGSGR
jgi:hypothetical protein